MAERTSYAPGTPSWVDLGTPDTEAASAFYHGLFGWTVNVDPRPEAGGYGLATLRGLNVAGVMAQMNPGPPVWSVYVAVADADETVTKITANGGTVVAGPMDVMDAGRMAVAQDPLGTFIGVWQAGAHLGAQLVNEPGTFTWNELASSDLDRSRDFYGAVFGWGRAEDDSHDPEAAAIFTVGGQTVCGVHRAGEGEFPAWSVWFAVEDCDAAAARVTELGGSIVMPPSDMDFGRGAVVADPQGAVFGIGAVKPEMMADSGA